MNKSDSGFLSRYKRWIAAFFVIWAILLAVLIFLGDGSQLPFQYQVF
ncbi:MAG: hypothetical protein VYA80_00075 [Pseudomonadota bacterium]|nr:hypothetical protein [Pseudomonadota bacterium]